MIFQDVFDGNVIPEWVTWGIVSSGIKEIPGSAHSSGEYVGILFNGFQQKHHEELGVLPQGSCISVPGVSGQQDPFACVLFCTVIPARQWRLRLHSSPSAQACCLQLAMGSSVKENTFLPPQGYCCPQCCRCHVDLCFEWDALCTCLFLLQLFLVQHMGSESL